MKEEALSIIIERIKEQLAKGSWIVAIDGNSASGKTTLSNHLASIFDCNVFHIDDYFLTSSQRTPERLNEISGNFDRERFLAEILIPLSQHTPVIAKKYNCNTKTFSAPKTYPQKALTIVEGCYSTHPSLLPYYDLTIFLSISPTLQRERILSRNPALAERFFIEWIPLENKFFEHHNTKNTCDITINVED